MPMIATGTYFFILWGLLFSAFALQALPRFGRKTRTCRFSVMGIARASIGQGFWRSGTCS